MSRYQLMANINNKLGRAIQQQGLSKVKTASANSQSPVGPLAHFTNMLKAGGIRSNLNQPALPYTATKSWIA